MTSNSAKSLNTKIAIGLAASGTILSIAFLYFLFVTPVETLALIDNANIKALLLTLAFLVLTLIGVLIYWAFHCPTVRRLTVAGWRVVLVYSAVAGGFSVFGWPRIRSFELNEQTGLKAQFSLLEVASEVWPNLAVCFAGIATMTFIYLLVGILEAKYGQEL